MKYFRAEERPEEMRISTFLLGGLLVTPVFGELEFKDAEGKHLDVVSDGKVVVRYMYAHDTTTPERHHETYKPYLHVFDAEGKKPITKGAGGQFTHHRGIFIGWSKIEVDGKRYDRWHMKGGDIVHQKFAKKEVKNGAAIFTSVTHWMDGAEKPFLEEERTFTVTEGKFGGRVMIDFDTKLTPVDVAVFLKGDPEHAGVQYRPANEVDKKKTKYVFPNDVTKVNGVKDLPWAAENYTLDGKGYGVVHMNGSTNPKGTVHSAYRDYGRFGAFFEKEIKKGESLELHYGFLILDGRVPAVEKIDAIWKTWAK
ncbi:MAG: hypothetical protein ACJAVK_000224 [Akkermansiaceae bacterium]